MNTFAELALKSWDATTGPPFVVGDDPDPSLEELWGRYSEAHDTVAELHALKQRTEERLNYYLEELSDAKEEGGQYEVMDDGLLNSNIEALRSTRRDERQRLRVLSVMLDMFLLHGDVPGWKELPSPIQEQVRPMKLGGDDVPGYAKDLIQTYRNHEDEINQFSDLHEKVGEEKEGDAGMWKNRRKNIRDRMNKVDAQWESGDIESFIRALEKFPDVEVGDSEETKNSLD